MDVKAVVKTYQMLLSIKATARHCHLSEQAVRRILITEGAYVSDRSARIADMLERGMTVEEIAAAVGIKPKTIISSYTPYTKGPYAVGEKSQNALAIARMRERRRKGEN